MPSGVVVGAGGPPRPRPPPPPPARVQIPEKSTLPSAVRGAGASRFGFPSAVRGTPAVGYDGHCAPIEGTTVAVRNATTLALPRPDLIRQPPAARTGRVCRGSISVPQTGRLPY